MRGSIYFRIITGNEDRKFSINAESGTISTVEEFDRELVNSYILEVEARSLQPDQALYLTILTINITVMLLKK